VSPHAWFFVLAKRIGADFGMEHYQLPADGTPEDLADDLFAGLPACPPVHHGVRD